jgi:hypothetical protein
MMIMMMEGFYTLVAILISMIDSFDYDFNNLFTLFIYFFKKDTTKIYFILFYLLIYVKSL